MTGYEVFIQPAIIAVFALVVLVKLVRGATRVSAGTRTVDGVEIAVKKWGYNTAYLKSATIWAVIGALVVPALVVTPPGHQGVIYSAWGGVSNRERVPGLSFAVPYFQTAVQMNVREQKFFTDEAFSQSKDLQEITVHVAVNYALDKNLAAELYDNVGKDYEDVLIKPAVFQFVKEQVGLVLAENFAQKRGQLASDILDQLAARLAPEGIIITFVSIVDAVFQEPFMLSVQNKVIADQVAAEQKRLVEAVRAQRDQIALEAEAEQIKRDLEGQGAAAAITAIADALAFTPAEYLEWLRLTQWDGILPTTVLGEGGDLGILLDLEE